jgi:hypothetical protein
MRTPTPTLRPLLLPALLLAAAALVTGCGYQRESDKGPMQQSGQAVDKAADQTAQGAKDATKATGQAVEHAGENMQKASD